MDRLLTPEEVAEILALSPRSVRNWLREGKLKGVKVGNLWRVKESDLEEYLRSLNGTQRTPQNIQKVNKKLIESSEC